MIAKAIKIKIMLSLIDSSTEGVVISLYYIEI